MSASATPRIAPGQREDIGAVNFLITRALGLAVGGAPPHLFTTLARHRRLFRPWLRFAGSLMPGGVFPRADSELVILRVAHNRGSEYEWRHHEHLAGLAGLSSADVERVRVGPDGAGWSDRQRLLLRAVDEVDARRMISDELWAELRTRFSDPELIELLMLIGHYEMLAMTLSSLRVVPDPPPSAPRGVQRVLRRLATRRTNKGGRR
jgi:alkylhydroperoxidase family enzyme